MGRGRAQSQLVGLAVDGDQPAADLAEDRGRHGAPSQVGAGASGGGDRTRGQEEVVVKITPGLDDTGGDTRVRVNQERALDQAALGTGAHDGGLGPLPQQQPERGEHHRLAGAGLTGQGGQAAAEGKIGLLDDTEVLDVQRLDHAVPPEESGRLPPSVLVSAEETIGWCSTSSSGE